MNAHRPMIGLGIGSEFVKVMVSVSINVSELGFITLLAVCSCYTVYAHGYWLAKMNRFLYSV